jgi:hypothetical protein
MIETFLEPVSFSVQVEHDPMEGVWFVASSDVPGLAAEAESYDALVAVIQDVAPDLILANLPLTVLDATRLVLRHTLSPRGRPAV